MALATVTHHSFQVGTKNAAPRGQTTGTSAARLGLLPEPAPQGVALGGGFDGMDASCLAFLLRCSQEGQEEKKRRKAEEEQHEKEKLKKQKQEAKRTVAAGGASSSTAAPKDAGLLVGSSWRWTFPGGMASSSPRPRRPN